MLASMHVSDWLPELLFTSHWLIVIGLSLRVIHLRRPVGVTLAWMLILLALPFFVMAFWRPRRRRGVS